MVATLTLFEALKSRFGEAEAKVIVEVIEKIDTDVEIKIEKAFEQKKEHFITIEDKGKLLTKADAIDIFASKQDISRLEVKIAELEARMNAKFNEQFRWNIIMWISQLGFLAAIIKYIK